MKQSIHDAFDTVSCDEVLKGRTCEYVIKHMHRSRKPAPRRMKWAVSLACLLLFATSGLGGYSLYYTEAAVISIDVNPSIELDINRWGKVVDQTTYGEESETVLQSLSLKHLEYEEALALLLASDAMQQYLKKRRPGLHHAGNKRRRPANVLKPSGVCKHSLNAVPWRKGRVCQRGQPYV